MTALIDNFGRSAEEREALKAKRDQLNKIAEDNWDNPQWRQQMAAELTETIFRGFEHENLIGLYSETQNAGYTDRVFIKEVRGLRAFWTAQGGYIEASNITANVIEVPRDTIAFHVYEYQNKVRSNFSETQSTLIRLGIERMDAEVNRRVFALFSAAIPTTSPYYSSGAGLSLTNLNTQLRAVRSESREFNVAIIGRIEMTDQIVEELVASGTSGTAAGFTPESNEEMLRRGVLGTYRGARIVTITNFTDDQRIPFVPANELFIVSRDASRFVFWGGQESMEWTDHAWYWNYQAKKDVGSIVHRPARLRRIVDTSIPSLTPSAD